MTTVVTGLLAASAAATAVGLPERRRLHGLLSPQGTAGDARSPGVRRRWTPPSPAGRLAAAAPLAAAPVCGVAALLLRGPVAGLVAALAVVLARRAIDGGRLRRDRRAERAGAVEACAALSAELRAGRAPDEALALAVECATGAVARALAAAAAAARLGADVGAVLMAEVDTSAAPALLRGLAACWTLCAATGGGLADAVDQLAASLRQVHDQDEEVQAELAGPRATAGLLAVLPLAGMGLAASLGARPLHVLLDTPAGVGCLAAGIGLDLLGLWWTGRIVRAAGGDG